ncbi:MAG: SufD family Fe-S cluster assembly protein [Lachnospiraceae bacterium]|nr:SufD family Fe-S cluster assembly protein [Lachnospiraceae bacterium]
MNRMPVRTFNRLKMNESRLEYAQGDVRELNIEESLRLDYNRDEDIRINVKVRDGEELSLIVNFTFKGSAGLEINGKVGRGSALTVIEADNAARTGKLISRVHVSVSDEGDFKHIQLYPARGDVYTDCIVDLEGKGSSFDAGMAYLGRGGQILDINHVATHYGKKSRSHIHADGVLMDRASKLFKGTIDFKTGCAGSKGQEQEKVLLLGDEIINRSIPVILCTEEDVEGSHGAAIGSMDEEMLLYLQSRGLSEDDARRMVIKGMFGRLLDEINDEEISEMTVKQLAEVV